jgi:small-conductance mechanosensitive channel
MWQQIVNHAQDWAPAIIASAIGILITALTDRVMRRRHEARKETHSGIIGPLMTFTLIGMTAVAVTLTLPIGDAARGQLLGLLGLLVTAAVALSSTTFLGNAMAGIMLRAIRCFRPGDFVRIGDHVGRVSDQGILHTEIQTEDRDLTTLPNLFLVSHPLTVLRSSGTVVSATISLGYDVPHQEIEKHLLAAALRAGLTDPFVQVLELGDFSITYRAAGFLTELRQLLTTRSNLRKAMLDTLHEAKIEIVSPEFVNLRRQGEDAVMLPRQARARAKHHTQDPEARIFDKADAAEAKDRMQSEYEAVEKGIGELEERIAASSFEAEKEELSQEVENAKKRLQTLKEAIKAQD